MALEYDLIHSVLTNKHVTPIIKNLTIECIQIAEVQQIYVWIVDYFKKYKNCPTPDQVTEKFPTYEYKVETTDVNYFTDKLREKKIEKSLTEVIMKSSTKLKEEGGFKALSLLRNEVFKINTMSSENEDIDITQNIEERKRSELCALSAARL